MRIDRLTLREFTVFEQADFEFSPGLNVFIGANGTGKSHVLKALYSVTRSLAISAPSLQVVSDGGRTDLAASASMKAFQSFVTALENTFRPEPGRPLRAALVRHGAENGEFTVKGDFGTAAIAIGEVGVAKTGIPSTYVPGGHAVFVPANEVLSIYPGFIAAYERRELSFDVTVRDLCVDLSASPLRTVSPRALVDVVTELDGAVGGRTVLLGDRFYVVLSEDWLLEASMLGEGLRKLAAVTQLIRNGSIAEGGALFWDEPEANLNPKLIPKVASSLMTLAGCGVQVFIATHDYLLSNELSAQAEYATEEAKTARVRFFAFSKSGATAPVQVESGETLPELHANPILEEFAAHYDRNQRLFAQAGPPAK